MVESSRRGCPSASGEPTSAEGVSFGLETPETLIRFHRILPTGLRPRRAMPDAAGSLPVSGYRYCEPVRLASAFGYYVFLPMSFQIVWDGGQDGIWSYDDGANWYPLSEAAFPDSMQAWDVVAPPFCRGYCPPFLTFIEAPGMLQVWTGWMASTAPGWSLLVRGPANLPRNAGYEVFEGIIETDRWFGPLFVNLRLTRSDAPIMFHASRPFLQVQPQHRAMYADGLQNRVVVHNDIKEMSEEHWRAYEGSLINHIVHKPTRGHYAKEARKRRAAEDRRGDETAGINKANNKDA
jgi:hypothetical protein